MEEQVKQYNIKSVKNLFVWQLPLFVIPLVWWLINIVNEIYQYSIFSTNYPNSENLIHDTIIAIIFSSNPLSPVGPAGPIFFLAWIIIGILGIITSKKYLKSATENKKIGKRLFRISVIMTIIPVLMLASFAYVLLGQKFIENKQADDIEKTYQEFNQMFSTPQTIKDIDMVTHKWNPLLILNNGQQVSLFCLNTENLDKLASDKETLIGKQVQVKLIDKKDYQVIYASGNNIKLNPELNTLSPEVFVYLNGENLNARYSRNGDYDCLKDRGYIN